MYYIIQKNLFRDVNFKNLITALDRLKLPYELVDMIPFMDEYEFNTKRTDVFPFGSVKMSRISRQYNWKPGSQLNENHDYMVYSKHYKENLLNYDSKIYKFGEDFFSHDLFFARPTADSKVFTGKVFDMAQWREFKNYLLTNGHTTTLTEDTEIQVASVKKLQNEIRFWIVNGEPVTASQYNLGGRYCLSEIVDDSAYDFVKKMIGLFELNDTFVMDIGLVNDEYKIIECGCTNSAGFYKADIQKLLIALENHFN